MNHIRRSIGLSSCALLNSCHPERSLAKSEANRPTQSKDLVLAEGSTGDEGNFRIVVRFLDEQDGEVHHEPCRRHRGQP